MIKSFKYRIYPTPKQEIELNGILGNCCELYNAALQERKEAYEKQKISISRYAQAKTIKDIRKDHPEYEIIYCDVLHNVIHRLDLAFQGFFRRVKKGEEPGYPRFKSKSRYNSFTFDHPNKGYKLVSGDKRLRIHGVGNVKIKYSRDMEGKNKQLTITKNSCNQWFAIFVCDEVPEKVLPKTGNTIGVDLGLHQFIATSDGEIVDNPKPFKQSQNELARKQRIVSKKKRGSKRQKKARLQVAKVYNKITNQRHNFHHNIAKDLIRTCDTIYIEDLNLIGLSRGMLSKSFNDVALGNFIQILTDKAGEAGREVIKVDPRNTSQECSNCGALVPKSLNERVHSCFSCGYEDNRDINAAKNILNKGINRGLAHNLQIEAVVRNTPQRPVNCLILEQE